MGYEDETLNGWIPVSSDPPNNIWVLLWLKADDGDGEPIGEIIGMYRNTDMGEQWCEKSVSGNINTGIRKDLITHYKLLEGGPGD